MNTNKPTRYQIVGMNGEKQDKFKSMPIVKSLSTGKICVFTVGQEFRPWHFEQEIDPLSWYKFDTPIDVDENFLGQSSQFYLQQINGEIVLIV